MPRGIHNNTVDLLIGQALFRRQANLANSGTDANKANRPSRQYLTAKCEIAFLRYSSTGMDNPSCANVGGRYEWVVITELFGVV
jgi:hypothetical protein